MSGWHIAANEHVNVSVMAEHFCVQIWPSGFHVHDVKPTHALLVVAKYSQRFSQAENFALYAHIVCDVHSMTLNMSVALTSTREHAVLQTSS